MKICAIISEYNPFHRGHEYHIAATREKANADCIICVMSGNFTQRGSIACMDKYTRAKHAVLAGADCVIELPAIYATSGADYFAKGAVELISKIKGITQLSFGSECGDIDTLLRIAAVTSDSIYNDNIKQYLSDGISYPVAAEKSMLKLGIDFSTLPNNTLAVSYINAIRQLGSDIIPLTIKRQGCGYHDSDISAQYPSATAIRSAIDQGENMDIERLPQYVINDLDKYNCGNYERLYAIIANNLLNNLTNIYEDNEGLVNRALTAMNKSTNYQELLNNIHSKRYTKSRIARFLIHIALQHTTLLLKSPIDYMRPLAVRADKADMILPSLLPMKSESPIYYNDIYADSIYSILTDYHQLDRRLQLIR